MSPIRVTRSCAPEKIRRCSSIWKVLEEIKPIQESPLCHFNGHIMHISMINSLVTSLSGAIQALCVRDASQIAPSTSK